MTRKLLFAGLALVLWAPVAEAAPKKAELYRTWTVRGSDTLGAYRGTLKISDGGRLKVNLAADLVYDGGAKRTWSALSWYVFGRIYARYTLSSTGGVAGALSGSTSSQIEVRVRLLPNAKGTRLTGTHQGPGFSGSERAYLPGSGYRWSSRVLASILGNHPGLDRDALLIEAVRQARAQGGNRYLNRTELEAAARALSNTVPALAFTSNHPHATLRRAGDDWVLTSDRSGSSASLGVRAEGTLTFDGHSVQLRASSTGYFGTSDLDRKVPEGYWAERVSRDLSNGTLRETFRLRKDSPGTLSLPDAVRVARAAIEDHVQTVRMHDADWQDYFPGTWAGLVAAGIDGHIATFASATDAEKVVYRRSGAYTIVGSGPFGLYTEVDVSKSSGQATRVFIEID